MTNTDINERLYRQLMEEVKERIQKLKEYGMSEKELTSLLESDPTFPQLIITRNYKFLLGDNRVEVRLEPLVKAVYLLFLCHPEGIIFKNLPDYRHELTGIYSEVRPWGLSDRALKSIEDVTNPMLNSINEKCARIRKAFAGVLPSSVARYYSISGKRGDPKKISLPRDLVVWEGGTQLPIKV